MRLRIKKIQVFQKPMRFTKNPRVIAPAIILVFVVAGTITLLLIRAATPAVTYEVESGTVAGSAAKQAGDTTASGGSYVKFGSGATPTAPLSRVATTAEATNCTHGMAAPTTYYCRAITSAGKTRFFTEHVPATVHTGDKVPLVMFYHATQQSASHLEVTQNFDAVADTKNFVAVYMDGWHPNSPRKDGTTQTMYWRPGTTVVPASNAFATEADFTDDTSFTADVIGDLAINRTLVDSTKVYVVGRSAGAQFAHRLACEASYLIRGVISISGNQRSKCNPTTPVAFYEIISSVGDVLNGYTYASETPPITTYPMADYTINTAATNPTTSWATRMHCTTRTQATLSDSNHPVPLARDMWSGCDGSSSVAMSVHNNGHNNVSALESNFEIVDWISRNP